MRGPLGPVGLQERSLPGGSLEGGHVCCLLLWLLSWLLLLPLPPALGLLLPVPLLVPLPPLPLAVSLALLTENFLSAASELGSPLAH
jgi:hypothetical protein